MMRWLVLLALLISIADFAGASEFGNIDPGVTTMEQVRDLYGKPSAEIPGKIEGYDTMQWVYDRSQAPEGLVRMIVDFGMLTPAGYKPTVTRLLTLEPKPMIFEKKTIIDGWGLPDGEGSRDGVLTFFYWDGLLVLFDKEGETAERMIFSIAQPKSGLGPPAAPSQPSAPAKQ